MLRELLAHAKRRGANRLRGLYTPTDRNKLVEQHYAKLGFALMETRGDGTTVWELEVASASVVSPPILVKILDFESFSREVAQ